MIITLPIIIYIPYLQKFAVLLLYSDNNEVLLLFHSKLVVCFTKPITAEENTIAVHLSVLQVYIRSSGVFFKLILIKSHEV